MRTLLVGLVALCGGCDRVFGLSAPGDLTDASIDAIALGDFTTPTELPGVNTGASEDDPSLTDDLLELYFDSSQSAGATAGEGDVWVAKRTTTVSSFDTPVLVAELSSVYDDTSPEISRDGLSMYFASTRPPSVDRDIYFTSRPNRATPWAEPVRVDELASPGSEHSAMETADRLTLFFVRDENVWTASRDSAAAPWTNIREVAELNTPMTEGELWIDTTATTIYFTSNRETGADTDLWFTTRASTTARFDLPVRVPAVNSNRRDVDPWLSSDQRVLVFARGDYPGGAEDLFIATR